MANPAHYVLIDTNVFVHKTNLLRSPLGTSLLHAVRSHGGAVILPELIEIEVREHFIRQVTATIDKTSASVRQLQDLTGLKFSVEVPERGAGDELFRQRLFELAPILVRTQLSPEIVRRSVQRVAQHRPPSRNGQQFKDCAIWFSALDVAGGHELFLITEDSGFFESNDLARGPASALLEDASASGITLYLSDKISSYLDRFVVAAPDIDPALIAEIVNGEGRELLHQLSDGQSYTIGDLREHRAEPFLTSTPGHIAYAFDATFDISMYVHENEAPDGVVHGFVDLSGEFLYSPARQTVDESIALTMCTYDEAGHLLSTWAHDQPPRRLLPPPAARVRHPFPGRRSD